MSIWKKSGREQPMPWGSEIQIDSPFGMKGKVIHLDTGNRTSLKHYVHINQCLYCYSGHAVVEAPNEFEFGDCIDPETGAVFELKSGDLILIQAGNPYRIKALEDSVLFEVLLGAHSGEFVRLEDDYGRVK